MKCLYAWPVFIASILLTVPSHAQKKSDVSRDQLIGPVHTMQLEIAEVATISGKETEIWRRPHQKVVYNRRGSEIERINFSEGSIENRTVKIVGANGRILGEKYYETIPGGRGERITSRSAWLYDKAGNRIEERAYHGKNLSQRNLTSYNAAGLVIEETRIADGGRWKQTIKYSYDSNGHRTRTLASTNGTTELIEEVHDDAGNLISYKSPLGWSKIAYDAKGRPIEHNSEDAHSKAKVVTYYDSKGRILRQATQFDYKKPNISRSHAPTPGTVEFRYDENDKLVEEMAYSSDSRLRLKTVSEYDVVGRIRSQVKFNGNSIMTSKVTYEYDSWGNPVKTVKIGLEHNGKTSTHVEYRLITYHREK